MEAPSADIQGKEPAAAHGTHAKPEIQGDGQTCGQPPQSPEQIVVDPQRPSQQNRADQLPGLQTDGVGHQPKRRDHSPPTGRAVS